uniref:NADH-ubiquinone oxidoreductase chain 4 n=1 Tax=Tremella fuciformis TaxID=64657 RepID=A0A2H4QBS1_9TREE|nr:hypothetical protein [Tremella fuciformis]
MPDASAYFSPLVQTVAIITLVYSSLATLRQSDFKALVAYSSIGHMAIVVLGLFSNTIVGIEGAILLSIAHGLISPALFILLGGVLYDRYHTRIIRYYRGLTVYMPVFSSLFFVASRFNMAVPLSLNWLGEFMSLAGIFQKSRLVGFMASSSIVLSACYTIFLFNRLSFGRVSQYLSYAKDITRREFALVFVLLFLTLLLGISPDPILVNLHSVASSLIYDIENPLGTPQCTLYNWWGVPLYYGKNMGLLTFMKPDARHKSTVSYPEESDESFLRKMYKYVEEVDTGGPTNNPDIQFRRLIARGGPYTLEDIHSIQELSGVPKMSRAAYDAAVAATPISRNLPMTSSERTAFAGSKVGDNTTLQGIYVFTNLITHSTRVGSAVSLGKRLYEHLTQGDKCSRILKRRFDNYGISNFTVTIYILPQTITYTDLLGVEQYFMLMLNPEYSGFKVVVNPFDTGGSGGTWVMTEEALLEHRLRLGKPIYLYNTNGDFLYKCLSIGHFKSLWPSTTASHNVYYRYIDTDRAYKGALIISSTPRAEDDLPIFSNDQIGPYLKGVFETPTDLSLRRPDPKSNPVIINILSPEGTSQSIEPTSSRNAVKMIQDMGFTVSRKRLDKAVADCKAYGSSSFTINNHVFSVVLKPK